MTDDALNQFVEQAKDGDVDAFEALCRAVLPMVERFLWQRVGNRATIDDLIQNTVLALYRNLHRMESIHHVRGFVLRVARNQTYDMLRREQRRPTVALNNQTTASSMPSPEEQTHWLLLYDAVRSRIAQLPLQQREALLMHHEQHLSYSEIATALNIPEGTVKTRIYHARKNLIRLLPADILNQIIQDD